MEFTLKKRTNVSFFILYCRFCLPGLFGILGKCVGVLSEFTLKKRTNVSYFILFCRFRLPGFFVSVWIGFFQNLLWRNVLTFLFLFFTIVDFGFLDYLGYWVSVWGWVLLEFTLKKRTNVSFFILFCRFRLLGSFGILGKCVGGIFWNLLWRNVLTFLFYSFL